MTEPTTEELVERLKTARENSRLEGLYGLEGAFAEAIERLQSQAQRLSDLEGKLGEALSRERWWKAEAEAGYGFHDQLQAAESKLGEARKALEPFASAAIEFDRANTFSGEWGKPQGPCPDSDFVPRIKLGWLRRAAEALKLTASGGGDNSLSQGATDAAVFAPLPGRPDEPHSAGGAA